MTEPQISNFSDDIKKIKEKILQKKAVFICGTGVSLSVAKNDPSNALLSWTGLLKHGAECAANRTGGDPVEFYDPLCDKNTPTFIEAAERITKALTESDQFNGWLKNAFSNLDSLINYHHPLLLALKCFWDNGNIVATTNYDDILCKAFNTHFYCLSKNPASVQELLAGDTQGILHLHGHYLQPESVVFGKESYQKITRDDVAQQYMNLLAMPYTPVFLGLGEGLKDPNFSSFIERINAAYQGTSRNWYILAREGHVADLRSRYGSHHCTVLNYGKNFTDLSGFLLQITPFETSVAKHTHPNSTLCMAPKPDKFIERPLLFKRLLGYLLSPDRTTPIAITAALHGAGGYGKTTLAAALCNDERVRESFSDGILWITLGKEPNLIVALTKLFDALSGKRTVFYDIEDVSFHLAEILKDKNCLIVIDDVWDISDLNYLLQGGPNCSRLFTTRIREIAAKSIQVEIDQMELEEATLLLSKGFEVSQGDTESLEYLAKRLGCWPLLLELANGVLKKRINRGDNFINAIFHLNQRLDKKGVIAFDAKDPKERNQAVAKTIEVSLELLQSDERNLYMKLAIFPEDIDIPIQTICQLWRLDQIETEELLLNIDNLSLLKLDLEIKIVRLHDELRNYLGQQLADPSIIHNELIESWSDLYKLLDNYAWRFIAYHLINAKQSSRLRNLLIDYRWIKLKLESTEINALLMDYNYLARDQVLNLIHSALLLSAHILVNDKSQLNTQLFGRLLGFHELEIQNVLERIRIEEHKTFWLRPKFASLIKPGGSLIRTLVGHSDSVNGLVLTQNDQFIVSASSDTTIKIWDLKKGQVIHTLTGHSKSVNDVATTVDGRFAVSASSDNTLKVWDLKKCKELYTLTGHSDSVNSVVITMDGLFAISASSDNTLRIWDLKKQQELKTLIGHLDSVNGVVLLADGRHVISASKDKTLKVWDLFTGQELYTLKGHSDSVNGVTITVDGKTIVSASSDNTLKIWDLKSRQELYTLTGHSNIVKGVTVTVDGMCVISASADKTLKVWNINNGQHLYTLASHSYWVNRVTVTTDGQIAISASSNNLKVWDLSSEHGSDTLQGHLDFVRGVAIAVDGHLAVSASDDKTLKVWDLNNGQEIYKLIGHTSFVRGVAVTPDGKLAVSASSDKTLKVWDLKKRQELYTLVGHSDEVYGVAVTTDGRLAVSASNDRNLKVWDLSNGHELNTLIGHSNFVRDVAVTQDGRLAVSASYDKTLKVWDLNSGQELYTLKGHSDSVRGVALTADGSIAISASNDYTIKAWDLNSGQELYTLEGHSYWVYEVAITADGRFAISVSNDKTLKVWDLINKVCIVNFTGDASLTACTIGSDDKTIFAGDNIGRVYFLYIEGMNDYVHHCK